MHTPGIMHWISKSSSPIICWCISAYLAGFALTGIYGEARKKPSHRGRPVSSGSADAKAADSALDGTRLKTGLFLYRELMNGSDAGNSEITIRKLQASGNFIYQNKVTGQSSQQWEAIATASFAPISAKLAFGESANMRRAFELTYQAGRVTGFALTKQHSERKIDVEVMPDTVDQRIDWAAAMSEELTTNGEFAFHVFDPGIGNSRVIGRIAGPETIRVPAGTFEAVRIVYRIEKAGGAETYQLLTNRQGPRILLKEEFPNGASSVLTEAKD